MLLLSLFVSLSCIFLNITPPLFRSFYIFRCAPTSIFLVLINTFSSVFLSTWPNHLTLASLLFSRMFATLLLFLHSLSDQSSLFPSSISTFLFLYFLASFAHPFSVPRSCFDALSPFSMERVLKRIRRRFCTRLARIKPGVHTNDFAPIYGRRSKILGHASPLLRYQPITTAVVTDACLNTRWHHGIYIICLERVAIYGSGRDNVHGSVGAMNAEQSRPDLLGTVQLGRKQA